MARLGFVLLASLCAKIYGFWIARGAWGFSLPTARCAHNVLFYFAEGKLSWAARPQGYMVYMPTSRGC